MLYFSRILFPIFFLVALLQGTPWIALLLGLAIGILGCNPLGKLAGSHAKTLLMISLVGMGFGIPITELIAAGREGILFTLFTISSTMILGWWLGRLMNIPSSLAFLVSAGTAICGATAIAAVAQSMNSKDEEISVSLATIYLLNACALLLFPLIGHLLGMSSIAYGMWSGVAIHDTSSVAAAAISFSPEALAIAVPVKLARALWIAPLALFAGQMFNRDKGGGKKGRWISPLLIYFVLASVISGVLPESFVGLKPLIAGMTKVVLCGTVFLIGAGFSRQALHEIGFKPIILGVALWFFIGSVSLLILI